MEGVRPGAEVVALRAFTAGDAERLAEIDRTESVAMLSAVRAGEIVALGHGCEVPPWSGAWLDEMVGFARRHLEAGATGIGAFAGERLVGVGILDHAPVRGDARELQLVLLHVSRDFRRGGVAGRLCAGLRAVALRRGACRLYISATPSASALGFYLSLGAELADPVDDQLFALEPEDVHLVLEL